MEDKLLVALLGKIQDVLSGENTVIGNESDYLAYPKVMLYLKELIANQIVASS